MFSIGDYFLYVQCGVCQFVEVQSRKLQKKRNDYYVLKPVHDQDSTIFVPVGNAALEARMIPLIHEDAIYTLLDEISSIEVAWIDNEALRKEHFRQVLRQGDRLALLKMLKVLSIHQLQRETGGRKLHLSDVQFMEDAKTALIKEFGFVLHTSQKQVEAMLMQRLNQT